MAGRGTRRAPDASAEAPGSLLANPSPIDPDGRCLKVIARYRGKMRQEVQHEELVRDELAQLVAIA